MVIAGDLTTGGRRPLACSSTAAVAMVREMLRRERATIRAELGELPRRHVGLIE